VTRETPVDCGPLTVKFFIDPDEASTLDTEVFDDDRSLNDYKLSIKYSEIVGKKGIYNINYIAYYTAYEDNNIILPGPFVITVIDPCENDASLDRVNLAN